MVFINVTWIDENWLRTLHVSQVESKYFRGCQGTVRFEFYTNIFHYAAKINCIHTTAKEKASSTGNYVLCMLGLTR